MLQLQVGGAWGHFNLRGAGGHCLQMPPDVTPGAFTIFFKVSEGHLLPTCFALQTMTWNIQRTYFCF